MAGTNPAMTQEYSKNPGRAIVATFKAIRIDKADKGTTAALTQFDEAELMDGDVTVRIEWSTLNYKDGLAVTGKAPVVRRFPMIAGIDFAGTVEQSSNPQWKSGDKVVCNGWGMGETHLGAYAEKARVKGEWLVRLPEGMSTREAMAIGTAGYDQVWRRHRRVRPGRGHGPAVLGRAVYFARSVPSRHRFRDVPA